MKTYNLFYLLLVCLIVSSCSKSDGGSGDEGEITGAQADYNILLTYGSTLKSLLLNADSELVTINPKASPFEDMEIPNLTYKDGNVIAMYQSTGDCSAQVLKYDFAQDTSQEIELFADLGTCELTAYAIAHSSSKLYIAYGIKLTETITNYFVRAIDLDASETSYDDVPLNKKPMDLVYSNNRLFILTLDEEITDENALSVMDTSTNTLLIEVGLGYNAQKIIKNIDGNLVISYDELHTLMNSETLAVQYINYEPGKEPKFVGAKSSNFDSMGSLYYAMDPGTYSIYPSIPAIYDFGKNLTILYAYENFLTEVERTLEYKIETTTTVGFDEKNGFMLVGYKKLDGSGKGGLLRIKTGLEPAVIDNLNLDGIPFDIIVK